MTIEQALINIEKELKCQEESRYCEDFCYKCPNFVGYDELTDTLRTLSDWVRAERRTKGGFE